MIKSHLILWLTGWRSREHFTPEKSGRYIVCLKNGYIMEFDYKNCSEGSLKWWVKIGIGEESKENPIIFWRPMPKIKFKI